MASHFDILSQLLQASSSFLSGVSNFSNFYFLKIKQKALKLIIPLLKKLKDCSFSFSKPFHLSESSPLRFTSIPILLWVY